MFQRFFNRSEKFTITGKLFKNDEFKGHCILKITEGDYLSYHWNSPHRKIITLDIGNEVFEKYLDENTRFAYYDGTRKFELFGFTFELDERYPSEDVENFRIKVSDFIWEAIHNEKIGTNNSSECCLFHYKTKIGEKDILYQFVDDQYVEEGKITYTFKDSKLVIRGENHELIVEQNISSEMNMTFRCDLDGTMSASWIDFFGNNVYQWCITFKDNSSYETFKQEYTRELFSQKNLNFTKMSNEDRHWATTETFVDWKPQESSHDILTEEQHVDKMKVGTLCNRAFITNNKMVEIFDPEKLKITGQFGTNYTPSDMLLHKGENNMMTLDEDDVHRVYNTDLHTGTIVKEWEPMWGFRKLAHTAKENSQSHNHTMWGMNRFGFLKMDTRTKDLVTDNFIYSPSSRPKFSCIASSIFGEIVTGSEDGYVRLYDPAKWRSGKTPKAITSFPLFGEPILGIDINVDATLILATCKTFLMLIETQAGGKNGFIESLGIDRKPPIVLRLSNSDVVKLGEVSFKEAKFGENKIVTATGNYVVTWDLKKKRYTIEKMDEKVVDVDFKWSSNDIVVATSDSMNVVRN